LVVEGNLVLLQLRQNRIFYVGLALPEKYTHLENNIFLDSGTESLDIYVGELLFLLVAADVVEPVPYPPDSVVTECAGLLLQCDSTDRSLFRRIGIVAVPYAAETNDWKLWRRHGIRQRLTIV
jgi:hypothetical protein